MMLHCGSILLLVSGLLIAECANSRQTASPAQNQDPRLIPSRVPRRMMFQRDQSGDPAHVWDTTSHLPANVLSPWILKRVQPVYPDSALRAKLEGKIIVAVWIEKEGNVGKVVALLASANCFVQPTMDAVALWKFSPPVKDCEALAIWVNLEFSFLLEDGKPVVVTPE